MPGGEAELVAGVRAGRRAWQRHVPRRGECLLSWTDGEGTATVPATIKDLSGGGVAVWTETLPPCNQPVWLRASGA